MAAQKSVFLSGRYYSESLRESLRSAGAWGKEGKRLQPAVVAKEISSPGCAFRRLFVTMRSRLSTSQRKGR